MEGHDEKNPDLAVARSYAEAPDIDGKIFIEGAEGTRRGLCQRPDRSRLYV